MATDETPKEGLLSKAFNVLENFLDERLQKSNGEKTKAQADLAEDEDIIYRKSAYKDSSYSTGVQGYQEKTFRLSFQLLREMARRDTVVSAVIQNYQNDVADFTRPAKAKHDKGFKICPKNERKKIAELMEEMFGITEEEEPLAEMQDQNPKVPEKVAKADQPPIPPKSEQPEVPEEEEKSAGTPQGVQPPQELTTREKERLAHEELIKRSSEEIHRIQTLLMGCGDIENRSFEDKRWNFESLLRAIVRDSLTYDQYAIERVYDLGSGEGGQPRLHHWIPVDSGTIRFATPALKQSKGQISNEFGYDILYPEKELDALQHSDAIQLDEKKLDADEYKWVQVIRGKVERAFTEMELCVGMRNPTTDIYANGYSIPELEILMNTISSHIFTENYNRLYFTQGFSAKGILHIKAPLPRRKLEAFRVQWNHLLKGNKNSFQTPIVSGMEDIQWIPLTQNHSDMEFANWMNYLIKVICSLFQIDPVEIGFGMKEEGRTGGSLGGDNTKEKIKFSREKGLKPLLTHLQTFINQHIVNEINPEFELVFVGLDDEDREDAIARQEKEVKFKKTINEIRAEDDLPPLDGCDKLILDANYMNWYSNMSPDGMAIAAEKQMQMMQAQSLQEGTMADPKIGNKLETAEEKDENPQEKKDEAPKAEEVQKSLVSIEHYIVSKE